MADMPTVQAPGQEAPPTAAAPQFDPVGEVRKRYPALKTWSDDQVVQNLSHPEKFRAAFPEYSHLDDATITRNMGKYAAPQPATGGDDMPQVKPPTGLKAHRGEYQGPDLQGEGSPNFFTRYLSHLGSSLEPGPAVEALKSMSAPQVASDLYHHFTDKNRPPIGAAKTIEGVGKGFYSGTGPGLIQTAFEHKDLAPGAASATAMAAGTEMPEVKPAMESVVAPISEGISSKLSDVGGSASEGAGRAIQSISGGPKRMAAIPPGSPVEGNLSRAEIAKYAEDKGIQLTPAQATGSRPLQTIQAIGERSLLKPGEDLQQHLEGQRQTFGNAVEDLKNRISPDVAGTEQVGGHLQQQAQQKVQALKDQAHADYAEFRDKTGDVPVDVTDIASKYSAKLDSMKEALANLPSQYASPIKQLLTKASEMGASSEALNTAKGMGYKSVAEMEEKLGPQVMDELKLKGAANQPRQIPMDTAQQLRSAFLDMSRDYSGNVPKRLQTMAGELAKDLDGTMQKSATNAGAAAPWRKANATWKQLQEVYNDTQSPLYRVLKESDPVKVPDKVLEVGQNGGSPRNLRLLRGEGFDLNPLKREVIDRIHNKNFNVAGGGAQARMGGYSLPFLKELFEPAELAEIQKLSRVGRAIKYESNPSGTSNVLMGEGQLHGFISKGAAKTVGIPAAAAKLSLSPRFFHGATGMPRVSPP